MNKALDYKDVSLVPRIVSTLNSRSEADTSVNFLGITLGLPVIAAPMPDVCDGSTAVELAKYGSFGIIHRFMSINQQVDQLKKFIHDSPIALCKHVGCAIGIKGDYQERFEKLYEAGCRIFCLDTANGANINVEKAVKWIRDFESSVGEIIYIIAGNVATGDGYVYLADVGVDAVRVGIAGGAMCETKNETGIYMPMITAISECSSQQKEGYPLIIADGGIRTPGDVAKAIVAGADVVMAGGIFAGTEEAPGNVINNNGRLVKLYRGAASFSTQREFTDKDPDYVEGRESFVDYKGKISKVIKRYKNGLASSMSYMNARNLQQFVTNSHMIAI